MELTASIGLWQVQRNEQEDRSRLVDSVGLRFEELVRAAGRYKKTAGVTTNRSIPEGWWPYQGPVDQSANGFWIHDQSRGAFLGGPAWSSHGGKRAQCIFNFSCSKRNAREGFCKSSGLQTLARSRWHFEVVCGSSQRCFGGGERSDAPSELSM